MRETTTTKSLDKTPSPIVAIPIGMSRDLRDAIAEQIAGDDARASGIQHGAFALLQMRRAGTLPTKAKDDDAEGSKRVDVEALSNIVVVAELPGKERPRGSTDGDLVGRYEREMQALRRCIAFYDALVYAAYDEDDAALSWYSTKARHFIVPAECMLDKKRSEQFLATKDVPAPVTVPLSGRGRTINFVRVSSDGTNEVRQGNVMMSVSRFVDLNRDSSLTRTRKSPIIDACKRIDKLLTGLGASALTTEDVSQLNLLRAKIENVIKERDALGEAKLKRTAGRA